MNENSEVEKNSAMMFGVVGLQVKVLLYSVGLNSPAGPESKRRRLVFFLSPHFTKKGTSGSL